MLPILFQPRLPQRCFILGLQDIAAFEFDEQRHLSSSRIRYRDLWYALVLAMPMQLKAFYSALLSPKEKTRLTNAVSQNSSTSQILPFRNLKIWQ